MATKSNRSAGSQHNSRGITQGNTLVGPRSGLPIDEIVDSGGVRRLAVDANVSLGDVTVNVDLDVADDGVHIGDVNTGFTLTVEADGSINVNTESDAKDGDNVAISAHPSQITDQAADTITTTAFEQVYTYTSTDNDTKITKVDCTVSTPALVQVKIGATIIRQYWTSPLDRNARFEFHEHRSLLNGQVLSVEAKVDRLIHASYETFTSIEGYIA